MEYFDFITVQKFGGAFYFKQNESLQREKYYSSPLGRNSHKLIYRLNGSSKIQINDISLLHKKDTILFLPKLEETDNFSVSEIEPGDCLELFFDSDIPLYETTLIILPKAPQEIKNHFFEINNFWLQKNVAYYFQSMSVFYKILYLIFLSAKSAFVSPHFKKIQPAIDYIDENFCNPHISCHMLAEICGTSYSYFRELFLETMKMSSTKYIILKRVNYARYLLASSSMSITDVAKSVGFSDVYYFSKTFKKITGFSPSAFKNS